MLGKKREYQYDLLRIFAMGLVIVVHSIDMVQIQPSLGNQIVQELVKTVILICNPIFFMLSGHFNLHFSGEYKADYQRYYLKKAVTIVLPLVIYQFIFYLVSRYLNGQLTNGSFFYDFFINVVQNYRTNYFWFMYPLIAFLIAAPFLSKMLDKLTRLEEHYFIVVLMMIQIGLWLLKLFKINTGISNYPFSGWLIYFILGRLVENWRLPTKGWTWLGIIGIPVINVLITLKLPQAKVLGLHDLSPFYMLFAILIYLGLRDSQTIMQAAQSKLVPFFARHSFGVYLCHGWVILLVVPRIQFGKVGFDVLGIAVVTYFGSLLVASILDSLVVRPLGRVLLSMKHS